MNINCCICVLLSDNPFGYGPPSQRQKQAQKYQVLRANEAVYEHRVGQLTAQYEDRLATRERNTVKKQQTRNQIDRLVEDLIVESMAAGEFDNLEGAGKPLPARVDYNPYMDFTTHKVNQILVETVGQSVSLIGGLCCHSVFPGFCSRVGSAPERYSRNEGENKERDARAQTEAGTRSSEQRQP